MTSKFFNENVADRYRKFQYNFDPEPFRGRVVLLVGGSGGLGGATAALLLRERAQVVISYCNRRSRAKALQRALDPSGDGRITLCKADITSEEDRQRLLHNAQKVGPVFGLVVLVGDPARGTDQETLDESLKINFMAPLLLARAAVEEMKANSMHGSVVLFSSMQGGYPFENSTAYAAAKAALVHGARVLAKESGGKANIRVNVVAPGATLAGMAQASVRSGKYDRFVQGNVVPRFGLAEDVARAAVFLLHPDSYCTGQVLTVDGGLTLRRDLQND